MMSSFHKVLDSSPSINGTRIKNNVLHISSGIPSLDHVMGGSLPAGSVFAVEEDVLGNYSRVLIKYFLAEGIVCHHNLLIASADEDPHEIVTELPQECTAPPEDEVNSFSRDVDKMKIAWRYEGLGQVESSFGSNTNFGHHFDLSKHISKEIIKNNQISYWSPDTEETSIKGFKNHLYSKLLMQIKSHVAKQEYQKHNTEKKKILRITIQSLGSPLWMAMDCEEPHCNTYGQDLIKIMYCLRMLVRDTTAVIFVTIPSHLFDDDDNLRKRLLYSVDHAVRIESFAGSSKETNPIYKDYHGLFHITKLSAMNTLVPFVPPSLDLAFKLRRKKFVIEKLHVPPELQESSEREQDDITAVPKTCGSYKKKDIDF